MSDLISEVLMPVTARPIDADLDLSELVARVVETRHTQVRLGAIAVANDCMAILDPRVRSVPRVYQGCHFHLRQLARGALARSFDPANKQKRSRDAKAMADLFTLQARYPEAHTADSEEPLYVLREAMTIEDVKYNVGRLQSEGRAKIAHGDALKAWWNDGHPDQPL